MLEPVAANMGVVPPRDGYLEAARDLSTRHGALLVFDEVISGFRLSAGGAQEIAPVTRITAGFGTRDVAFLRSPGGILFELIRILENAVP